MMDILRFPTGLNIPCTHFCFNYSFNSWVRLSLSLYQRPNDLIRACWKHNSSDKSAVLQKISPESCRKTSLIHKQSLSIGFTDLTVDHKDKESRDRHWDVHSRLISCMEREVTNIITLITTSIRSCDSIWTTLSQSYLDYITACLPSKHDF